MNNSVQYIYTYKYRKENLSLFSTSYKYMEKNLSKLHSEEYNDWQHKKFSQINECPTKSHTMCRKPLLYNKKIVYQYVCHLISWDIKSPFSKWLSQIQLKYTLYFITPFITLNLASALELRARTFKMALNDGLLYFFKCVSHSSTCQTNFITMKSY